MSSKENSSDDIGVIWAWSLQMFIESLCYKLRVQSLTDKMLLSCIMGNVGSSSFGTSLIPSQDISAGAALLILPILFFNLF